MELKTHHEAWTGDKSVKRRFKLRNSELTGVSQVNRQNHVNRQISVCRVMSRVIFV